MVMKKLQNKRVKFKKSWDDRIFDLLCNAFLIFFVIIVFYPIYFVLIASFTEPTYVNSGKVLLFPPSLYLEGYKQVWADKEIWIGYANTIWYVICGSALGVSVVMMAGYAMSRRDFLGKGIIMKIMVFPMYFGGGAIPLFLVIKELGLLDTRLIMILLGSVSVSNVIMVRSFMYTNIPEELFDAAIMDGCGHGKFLVRIVLPLSKAIMSVMVLYLAVGYWNSYFNAMMFITDPNKYPLQLFLRRTLLLSSTLSQDKEILDPDYLSELLQRASVIKYSIIVVATAPILCVYPFIQKYFVKGVTIGAVKG